MGGHVELSVSFVHAKGSSVESDDVSKSVNYRKILESLGVDYNSCELLAVQGRIDDLERADEFFRVGFVWESSIDDHTVNVVSVR